MKIKDWPLDDRPREKFVAREHYGLTEAEYLAIIIGKGMKNRTAVDVAKDLLQSAGGLEALSTKTLKDIERMKIPGLGRAKIITVLAALELGRRSYSKPCEEGESFKTVEDVCGHYTPLLSGLKFEVFKVVAVDNRNRFIKDKTISKGISNASLVHPREVFQFAMEEKAASIFLIHNHPSGVKKPSPDDINITERLRHASEILGIPIIDHIIIAGKEYYSFREHNLL